MRPAVQYVHGCGVSTFANANVTTSCYTFADANVTAYASHGSQN